MCEDQCKDVETDGKKDIMKYMRRNGAFEFSYTGLQLIGLAIDGHPIYGPYNEDHELWTCEDHDVCNGHWFTDMENTYAYITTSTHPYMIGCWGPGPTQVWQHDCSTSVCGDAVTNLTFWVSTLIIYALSILN